jgi:hypothetical protein
LHWYYIPAGPSDRHESSQIKGGAAHAPSPLEQEQIAVARTRIESGVERGDRSPNIKNI